MEKDADEHHHQGSHHALDFAPQPLLPLGVEENVEHDYLLHHHLPPTLPPPVTTVTSLDKLSFADVMQFADFGPKLGLSHQYSKPSDDESNFFLKFPVLGDEKQREEPPALLPVEGGFQGVSMESKATEGEEGEGHGKEVRSSSAVEVKSNRRKRPRAAKTSEEVESQRMTHIAVERNRRKQMNEHLRVLRSLMPGSYVQRGDQASIIGGAIEFVRELEQLLQCLESQKRRRVYGGEASLPLLPQPPFFPPPSQLPGGIDDPMKLLEFDPCGGGGLREESAENKSCLADVEVKILGFDAVIKVLTRRGPGQLLKAIAALEELRLDILHTNITTIEQTVLYSFNVKIAGETVFTAEEMANSVQQIFSFINASTLDVI